MNKYKVITVDGEIEISADGVYGGGKDLVFHRKGEWVEPVLQEPVPRARGYFDGDGLAPIGGYSKTEYVAGFNGDYWRSYRLIGEAEAA